MSPAVPAPASPLAAIVIGRNEGGRLVRCLASVGAAVRREGGAPGRVVYVDSGSTDGSLAAARAAGAVVVALDPAAPFTAARARNAGLAVLRGASPEAAGSAGFGPRGHDAEAGPTDFGLSKRVEAAVSGVPDSEAATTPPDRLPSDPDRPDPSPRVPPPPDSQALLPGPGPAPTPAYVQFIDGDCEIRPGWIPAAMAFLETHPEAAVACGRRRERFPEASVWNRLCDAEWDTPVGPARACGGDALIRMAALDRVGGYDPRLIAGEEPEMCVRLRQEGWTVWRLDVEMTLHDAAMTRFSQWWTRMRRGGHAAAEGMAMHGAAPERHGVASVRRALLWGLVLPVAALAGCLWSPWSLLLLLAWPAQVVRLALRDGAARNGTDGTEVGGAGTDGTGAGGRNVATGGGRAAWEGASFLTLGKIPEAMGVLDYLWRRGLRRPATLIEYK